MLNPIEEDADIIARLFGSAAKGGQGGKPSRLQFFDLKMTDDSMRYMAQLELDTYMGEIKFENAINRLTAAANPRQIERCCRWIISAAMARAATGASRCAISG